MKIIFGASGQIGSALNGLLSRSTSEPVRALPWSEVGHLSGAELGVRIQELRQDRPACDLIFCNGITDPRLPEEVLLRSNFEFPKKVIEATWNLPGMRYVTLGTIFELFPEACKANPYLRSKFELGRWIQTAQPSEARLLHFRLHTLYGGRFVPYMFLGLMMQSILSNAEFRMSHGQQIREYHHIEDVAKAIARLIGSNWRERSTPLFELSSGNPLPLKEIARAVFQAVNRESLLKIGAIDASPGENQGLVFEPTDPKIFRSRDTLEGIVSWFRASLEKTRPELHL